MVKIPGIFPLLVVIIRIAGCFVMFAVIFRMLVVMVRILGVDYHVSW